MDLTAHLAQLQADGYTILERVIPEPTVDALLGAVHEVEAAFDSAPSNNRFEGSRTTRTYNLLARGEIFEQIPVQPHVLALIESMLGPQCLVSSLASISIAPATSFGVT